MRRHHESVEAELTDVLEQSKKQVVNNFLPIVQDRPTDILLAQFMGKPGEAETRRWLENELGTVFSSPRDLASQMRLNVSVS